MPRSPWSGLWWHWRRQVIRFDYADLAAGYLSRAYRMARTCCSAMALPIPGDCRYADSHEYVRPEGERLRLGLSAFAVDQLGDIVFVELPAVGASLVQGASFGSVESVKAVEDLLAPVSGVVLARNEAVLASPEELQNDPYGEGWLLVLQPADPAQLAGLLDAATYSAKVQVA